MTAGASSDGPEPTDDIPVADAHIHVWTGSDPRYPMRVPADRYPRWRGETGDYLAEMGPAGVDRAVIVQIPHHGFDHSYALAARDAHPERFAVVGRLDPDDPGAPDELARLVRHERIQGIRITHRDDQDAKQAATLDRLWEQAADLGAPILFQLPARQLGVVDDVAGRFPHLRLLVDHAAQPDLAAGPPFGDIAALFDAAGAPNVYVKTSHLFGLDRPAGEERHIPALLGALRDAFGADRLLFGSNWPLVRDRGGLARCVADFRRAIADWEPDEQRAILHDTAATLYRWAS